MDTEIRRNIYELLLPEGRETLLYVKTEMPQIDGDGMAKKRINRFYGKKNSRLLAYFKSLVEKGYRKKNHVSKHGGIVSLPSVIKLTYRVTRCDESIVSFLFLSESVTDSRMETYYSAESWDMRDGHLILLSDLLFPVGTRKKALYGVIYESVSAMPHCKPHLMRNIRRYYATDNYYYDGEDIVIFYQPGTLREANAGITEIRMQNKNPVQ